MSDQLTLRPCSDGTFIDWGCYPTGDKYATIDEVTPDDSDYISASIAFTAKKITFGIDSSQTGVLDGATINKVTLKWNGKFTKTMGGDPFVYPLTYDGSNTDQGSGVVMDNGTYDDHQADFEDAPDGGDWSKSKIDSGEFGFNTSTGFGSTLFICQFEIIVDYDGGSSNYPAPTSLQADRSTNPTSCSEVPGFTAVFNDGSRGDTVDRCQIQVSEQSDFSDDNVWNDSPGDDPTGEDWNDIDDLTDGNTSQAVQYGGSYLENGKIYYWRIRFGQFTGDHNISDWSTGTATIAGPWKRQWEYPDYGRRNRLIFGEFHPAIPAGASVSFPLPTGLRKEISGNRGCCDESVQDSGGWMDIGVHNNIHYWLFLSKPEDNGNYAIYIQAQNLLTQEFGTPYKIADSGASSDTHYFPTGVIDADGYIHVFYGCHTSSIKYRRSAVAGESGCFDGETSGWSAMSDISGMYTYPQAFIIPSDGRIYLFARQNKHAFCFFYSDNNGTSWDGAHTVLDDDTQNRVYCYGTRFDPDTETFHVAYTWVYSNPPTNDNEQYYDTVCYMQSTYDPEEDDGFVKWYGLNPSIVGFLVSVGTTDTDVINRAGSYTIIDAEDSIVRGGRVHQYFVISMILYSDSGVMRPLIFYIDKFGEPPGSFADKVAVNCVKFDWIVPSDGWTTTRISEDLDQYLVATRQNATGNQNSDTKEIKVYMSTQGNNYLHQIPDGDISSSNCTPKTGSDNYAMVDEAPFECDGDDQYISLANQAHCLLSSSKDSTNSDINLDDYKILGIEVEAVVRMFNSTTGGKIKLYLNDGSTDDEGDEQNVENDKYAVFKDFWQGDPFESTDWTFSTGKSVYFGIKQTVTGKGVLVTRLIKKYYVTSAIDPKYNSSKIIEMISDDEGDTWSYRMLEGDCLAGVPIITTAHHLINKQISIMWCAGNKVFTSTDAWEQWTKVRPDGLDVKVDSGGTQIDRVIDYPNTVDSRVQIKLPVAVAENEKYPPKDIFVYTTKPSETTDPQGDPDDSYNYWESFEDIDEDEGLATYDATWTVSSGSFKGYRNPPNHANKRYSGQGAIESQTSAVSLAYKNIDATGLTDVMFIASFWCESAGDDYRCWIGIKGDTGKEFRVGIITSSGYGCYYDGSSWHNNTSQSIKYQQMHIAKIQVTSKGCSAWIDDYQICEEVLEANTPVKLKDIYLRAPGQSFFDALRIVTNIEKSSDEQTIAQADVTNKNVEVRVAGYSDAEYVAMLDGKMDFTEDEYCEYITEIKLKMRAKDASFDNNGTVKLDIYVSNDDIYDEDDLDTTVYDATMTSVDSDWTSQTFTLGLTESGDYEISLTQNKSLKVSAVYSSGSSTDIEIEEIKYTYKIQDVNITLDDEEQNGLSCDMTVLGEGNDYLLIDMNINGELMLLENKLPVEYQGSLNTSDMIVIEALKRIFNTDRLLIDQLRAIPVVNELLVSHLLAVTGESKINIDNQKSEAIINKTILDFIETLITAKSFKVDIGSQSSLTYSLPIDHLKGVKNLDSYPIEWKAPLTTSKCLFIENKKPYLSRETIPVENLKTYIVDNDISIECADRALTYDQLPVEWKNPIDNDFKLPIEFKGQFQTEQTIPLESLKTTEDLFKTSISFSGYLTTDNHLLTEWAKTNTIVRRFIIDATERVSSSFKLLVDHLKYYSAHSSTPIDLNRLVAIVQKLPLEYKGSQQVEAFLRMPIDWRVSLDTENRLRVETTSTSSSVYQLRHEYIKGISSVIRAPIEYRAITSILSRITTDWARRIQTDNKLPIDYSGLSSSDFKIPIENIKGLIQDHKLPIEFSGSTWILGEFALPIDWRNHLSTDDKISIDLSNRIKTYDRLVVDYGVGVEYNIKLPTDYQNIVTSCERAIIHWLERIQAIAHLSIEWAGSLTVTDSSLRLTIDYGNGVATTSSISIEYLRAICQKYNIPLEWAGTLYAFISHLEASLILPGTINVEIKTPCLSSAILRAGSITVKELRQIAADQLSQTIMKSDGSITAQLRDANATNFSKTYRGNNNKE